MGKERKVALALGGGFFRGIAHIGALMALEENGIRADMICGTSMGAVIGSIYACGMRPEMLARLACEISERQLYDVGIPRRGMIKGEKISVFLRTLTGDKDFTAVNIPFSCVACDIEAGEQVVLNKGKIYKAVRASLSVPGVFAPVDMDGRILVDGGVLCRVPSREARAMGADVVIAVDVGARQGVFEVSSTIDIIMRAIELMEYRAMRADEDADIIITPPVRHINMMRMTQAAECIEIGYKAVLERIDEIKRLTGEGDCHDGRGKDTEG